MVDLLDQLVQRCADNMKDSMVSIYFLPFSKREGKKKRKKKEKGVEGGRLYFMLSCSASAATDPNL